MKPVIQTDKKGLSHDHLLALATGDVVAIQLKDFCHSSALGRLRAALLQSKERGPLTQAKEFGRLGIAFSETNDATSRSRYHREASCGIRRIREIAMPFFSPIDELRLLLDERWRWGANLLQLGGEKCFVGICRYQDPKVDLKPHTDRLERNLPIGYRGVLWNQLSANVYLSVPSQGGELEFWDLEPQEEEYDQLKGDKPYGIDREKLPPPEVFIKPGIGDLVLLNPRKVHAVRPGRRISRVTLSMFIGFLGDDQPLVYWS